MVARVAILVACFALIAVTAHAFINPFVFGGRAQYMVQYEQQATPFPTNVSGNSAVDRTHLMLDLKTKQPTYGALYLRGLAVWDGTDPHSRQKAFQFDQGDYFWSQQLSRGLYGVRGFANEQRFFVHDMIAPILDNDPVDGNDNLGLRFDGELNDRGTATVIYSSVGDDLDDARQLAYLKAGYAWRALGVSSSYLYEDPGAVGDSNRAVFKLELTTAYKMVSLIAAYQRSERKQQGLFFPNGGADFGNIGDGPAAVLSPGAGMHAELRVNPMPVPDGRLWFVYRYDLAGAEYAAEFARLATPAWAGHTPALYYKANDVNMNARLLYHHSSRWSLESEDRDLGELGVWATLRNGTDLLLRTRVETTKDGAGLATQENFVDVGVRYTKRKIESGVNVMWTDLGTDFSGIRYAWTGKIVIGADWRFDWRLVTDQTLGTGEQPYFRLEYRPNNRIYLVGSYGRDYISNGLFVLEDVDGGLARANASLYQLSLRGDF